LRQADQARATGRPLVVLLHDLPAALIAPQAWSITCHCAAGDDGARRAFVTLG